MKSVFLEQEATMHEPIYDMVLERQSKMRQVAEDSRKIARIKSANPSMRQRLFYRIGGMLINLGTRLREKSPEPYPPPAPATSYGTTEGC